MIKRIIISLLFILMTVSVFSMGQTPGKNNGFGGHRGGGGTPEPATILLILGGVGAAVAVKKYKDS